MAIDFLNVPVYEIICPECKEKQSRSLMQMVMERRFACGECGHNINVADQYRRTELEDIFEALGRGRNFISVNDQ